MTVQCFKNVKNLLLFSKKYYDRVERLIVTDHPFRYRTYSQERTLEVTFIVFFYMHFHFHPKICFSHLLHEVEGHDHGHPVEDHPHDGHEAQEHHEQHHGDGDHHPGELA